MKRVLPLFVFLLLALTLSLATVYLNNGNTEEELGHGKIKKQQSDFNKFVMERVKELEHPDPNVRRVAAFEMKQFRASSYLIDTREELAFDTLVKLLNDDSEEVRYSTIAALANFRTPKSIEALLKHYPNEQSTEAKKGMFSHPATIIGHNKHILPLAYAALDDPDKDISSRAAREIYLALHLDGPNDFIDIDSQKYVAKILAQLKTATDENRGNLYSALAPFPQQREQTIPVLLKGLESRHANDLKGAAQALGRLRAKEAVPQLIALLKSDPHEFDGASTPLDEFATALGFIGDARAVTPLIEFAKTGWESSVIIPLGMIGDNKAYPYLHNYLETALKNKQDNAVMTNTILALGNLGDRRAFPLLTQILKMKHPEFQCNAALSLANLKATDAIPQIEKLKNKIIDEKIYTLNEWGNTDEQEYSVLIDKALRKLYSAKD